MTDRPIVSGESSYQDEHSLDLQPWDALLRELFSFVKQAPIRAELRSLHDRSGTKAFDFLDEEFFKLIETENDVWDAQQQVRLCR